MTPALAQQTVAGVVSDWTHQRVFFSNPGTLENAIMTGRLGEWLRIVSDPRYRLQQIKRNAEPSGPTIDSGFSVPRSTEAESSFPMNENVRTKRRMSLHGDWRVPDSGVGDASVGIDQYPAKYTFSPVGSPDCVNDFVVYPINTAGKSSSQADLLGVNNMYETTCTGTVPTVLFAYFIGTGVVQTSPVLSLDGTKLAFVESRTNGSIFHVLTMDKSGNSGCPSSPPCNGTAYNSPAAPGTNNSAVDTKITMSGNVSVTRSEPFVDYTGDIGYVGDDTGQLHKFTGVFTGTPTEVTTSPGPFTVASGVILTGPVFDGGASQNIFVGGSDGNLYCVTAAGAACSTPSVNIGTGPVEDEPIVDSTAQTVFAAANNSNNAILSQVTTALGSQVSATMGDNGTDLYDGAFDNAYFTSMSTGHMYFCGNLSGSATPALWRVTFNSSGTMSSSNDGNFFQLVVSGFRGIGEDCTPLTEVFNASQGADYLFLGVTDNGFQTGTPNCDNDTCIMSFSLPTSAPFTFPTGPVATTTASLGTDGISGMIIDNVSSMIGASQIYFGNPQISSDIQASQSALQ